MVKKQSRDSQKVAWDSLKKTLSVNAVKDIEKRIQNNEKTSDRKLKNAWPCRERKKQARKTTW